MAKQDFAVGLLKGLYEGGVGNPAVGRQQALEDAFVQQKAAEAGMVPVTSDVPPTAMQKILQATHSILFPGSNSFQGYQPDPNRPVSYVDATGKAGLAKPGTKLTEGQYNYPFEKTVPLMNSQNAAEKKAATTKENRKFYFVDSASRKLFDASMNPITMAPPGATPKIISDPYAGSEFARRNALVSGAMNSVETAKQLLTPDILSELKAIKFTPGKMYSQIASPDAQELYRNLYNAIANQLYLKTGATANPNEIENNMIMYMPALNEDVNGMLKRLDMLSSESSLYERSRAGAPENKNRKNSSGAATHRWNPETGQVEEIR